MLGVTRHEISKLQENMDKGFVRELIGLSIVEDAAPRRPDKLRMLAMPGPGLEETKLYLDMVSQRMSGTKLWYTGVEGDPELSREIENDRMSLRREDRGRFNLVTGDITDRKTMFEIGESVRWRKFDVVHLDYYRLPVGQQCKAVENMHNMGLLRAHAMILMTACFRKRSLDVYPDLRDSMERMCTIPGKVGYRFIDLSYATMMVIVGVTHSGHTLPDLCGRLHCGINGRFLIEKHAYSPT